MKPTSDPVHELERPRDLAADERDDEHGSDEAHGDPVRRRRILGSGDVPGDQGEEAVASRRGPAAGDEGEVEQPDGEDRSDEEAGWDAAEPDRRHLARGEDVAADLHVVEGLQKDRDAGRRTRFRPSRSVPIASGARSHSPLPIESPSAMRLGPMTSVTASLDADPGAFGRPPRASAGPRHRAARLPRVDTRLRQRAHAVRAVLPAQRTRPWFPPSVVRPTLWPPHVLPGARRCNTHAQRAVQPRSIMTGTPVKERPAGPSRNATVSATSSGSSRRLIA